MLWKRLAGGFAVLLAILAGTAWYVFATIDQRILAAIETNGSAATTTKVTVGSVGLSLVSGRFVVSGLIIGNPPGFHTPYAVALGDIGIDGEVSSLAGKGPIIIHQVNIDRPHIFYEIKGGGHGLSLSSLNLGSTSNLGTLQHDAANRAKNNSSGPGRKEIIEDLTVTHGEVSISAPLLLGRQLDVKLPEIHLTGIGQGDGGVTAAQAGNQVLTAISNEATLASAATLVKAIGGAATGPVGNAIGITLKSLF